MTICFYHGVDGDGKCSGALVKQKIPETKLYPVSHSSIDNIEFLQKNVNKDEVVIICDFCFSIRCMQFLLDTCVNVIWLDHHVSSIKSIKEAGLSIQGIRNVEKAGCEFPCVGYCPDFFVIGAIDPCRSSAQEHDFPQG